MPAWCSDIDDLLEDLDGVLEDWLNGLHDTESFLHINDNIKFVQSKNIPAIDLSGKNQE